MLWLDGYQVINLIELNFAVAHVPTAQLEYSDHADVIGFFECILQIDENIGLDLFTNLILHDKKAIRMTADKS